MKTATEASAANLDGVHGLPLDDAAMRQIQKANSEGRYQFKVRLYLVGLINDKSIS